MTHPINLLCVGSATDEFAGLEATLASMANISHAPNLPAAMDMLGNRPPDLIVPLQGYPGQFAASDVEKARRLAPLARWITVLGTWCEGEARSGQPLPGVMRVYWHQAEAHFRQELQQLYGGRRSSWTLPATATEEERLLAVLDEPLPQGSGLVAIHAASRATADYLADICRLGGYATVWIDPRRPAKIQGVVAAIYDSPAINGSDADCGELAIVRKFVAAMAPAPVIVLVNFPRPETVDQLTAMNVRQVLAKPIVMPELLWHLANDLQP